MASPSPTAAKTGITPYEFSREVNNYKVQEQEILDTVTLAGEQMLAASEKPQFVQGTKTGTEVLAEKLAEQRKEQQVHKALEAVDYDRLMITLGQDLSQLVTERRAISQQLKEDSAVSLFDDPFTALRNAFTLPWTEQQLEGIDKNITAVSQDMSKVNSFAQQAAQTAELAKASINDAVIADTASALEAHAAAIKAKTLEDVATTRGKHLKSILEADRMQLTAYIQQKELEDRAEARAQRNKEFNLRMAKFNEAEKTDEQVIEFARHALRMEGKKGTEISDFHIKSLRGGAAKYFEALVRKGMQYSIQGDNWNHGEKLAERVEWQASGAYTSKTEQEKRVVSMQVAELTAQPPVGVTDKKAWAASADSRFEQTFIAAQSDIREGSVFEAPSYSLFASQATPAILNHPIWKDYIQTSAVQTDPNSAMRLPTVLNAAVKAIKDGKVKPAEAREFIKDIFSRAVEVNNTVHRFSTITGGLEQRRFGVQMDLPGPGGIINVDALNGPSLDDALAKMYVRDTILDKFSLPNGMGLFMVSK